MDTYSFAENGIDVSELDDYQTEELNRNRDLQLCIVSLLGMAGSLGCFVWLSHTTQITSAAWMYEGLLIAEFFIFLICGLLGFRIEAQANAKLPSLNQPVTPPNHITGLGAAVALLLFAFIAGAAWLGQANYPNFIIPEWAGQAAIVVLCGGFMILVFATRISDLGPFYKLMNTMRAITAPLDPAGRLLSRLDSWLVYIVAPLAGAGLQSGILRYAVLIGQLGSACAFSWYAPAPFGLLGSAWALIIAISVSRRWSWIEADRSTKHEQPDIAQSQLKVGTGQDLRDEALFSLLFLVLILPLGMRQFHLSFPTLNVFSVAGEGSEDFAAWTSFFGVELLKSLPFLDWADIYDAHGLTRVQTNGPAAMHVVFGARIILDLVFLAALLQAITISVSLAKHKRQFLEQKNGVTFLDERIEQAELMKLAMRRSGEWEFRPDLTKFLHYNPKQLDRLHRYARTHRKRRLEATVKEIIRRANLTISPPGEQLVDVASEKRPSPSDLRAAIKLVIDEKDFDLEYLMAARLALRRKGGVETERTQIAQLIRKEVKPSAEREEVFAEMLSGEDEDSLAQVRLIAVESLIRNYRQFERGLESLKNAALHDRSGAVQKRATSFLKSIGIELTPHAGEPEQLAG